MNVLSVGYPLFPVSTDSPGGAEQILAYIDRLLVGQGHRSLVMAAAGSHVSGMLIPTAAPNPELISEHDRQNAQAEYRTLLEGLLRQGLIDLIHFHGLDFHTYLPETSIPMLATLHLPMSWYPTHIFNLPGLQLNCVSQSQAGTSGLPVVPNGIDTHYFFPEGEKGNYLLWLGRICPEKGVHLALRAAHELDLPLRVAGPVHPLAAHQDYYDKQVKPLLDGKRVHLGPVGREQKRELLRAARGLLVPSLVDETSSLVSMEAMSCGTPVIAYNSGALPEVVQHGVTGFIVESIEGILAAVRNLKEISGERCRSEAVRRFDVFEMGKGYMALHEAIMHRAAAPV